MTPMNNKAVGVHGVGLQVHVGAVPCRMVPSPHSHACRAAKVALAIAPGDLPAGRDGEVASANVAQVVLAETIRDRVRPRLQKLRRGSDGIVTVSHGKIPVCTARSAGGDHSVQREESGAEVERYVVDRFVGARLWPVLVF
jgi:hypothetical protein